MGGGGFVCKMKERKLLKEDEAAMDEFVGMIWLSWKDQYYGWVS